MANMYWKGTAAAAAQVDTITPGGTIEVGDVFTLTVTGENGDTTTVSFPAAATTAANVAAGMVAAWNASTHYLCTGITASGSVTVILTADTAGVPFYVAASTTEAGGGAADDQTFIKVSTVANSGPYDWNTLANWDGDGDLPGADASDVVYIDGGYIKYGLDQSGIGNALSGLYVSKAQIGENGSYGKSPSYLKILSDIVSINQSVNPGTSVYLSPVNIDTLGTASAITVWNSGTNSTEPSVNLKVNKDTTTITVYAGYVGVANYSGITTTIASITILGGYVYMGSGVTWTTLTQRGGYCYVRSAGTTINQYAGYIYTYGSGALTTINQYGGSSVLSSSGTITALNVIAGSCDMSQSNSARTVTTAKVGKGASLKYDPSIITMTNKIQPYDSSGAFTFALS